MKKNVIIFLSIFGLILNGCANTTSPNPTKKNIELHENVTAISTDSSEQKTLEKTSPSITATRVEQGGPYGLLSLSVPAGWHYETYPMDSEKLSYGLYGIQFFPEDATDGYITLAYIDNFGVCGTGLVEESLTLAGKPATMGIYDNHDYWNFIAFDDAYTGIVALSYDVENWWETDSEQVLEILNTVSFDTSIKEGGTYIHSAESEIDKIGLYLTLKKITPAGAILVFHQYDENAPTGELNYGDAFVIEVQKNNIWEEVPVVVDGEYAFHDIAYNISNRDTSVQELDWTWLYGTLQPGNYRIKKEIMDFRKSGDYDKYTLYAQFTLN